MLDFFQKQLAKIEKELQELYIARGNAGVESQGSYENVIAQKNKERERLLKDIETEKNKQAAPLPSQPPIEAAVESNNPKETIRTLINQNKLKEAIEIMKINWNDNSIILLSARFRQSKDQMNNGVISHDQYTLEINKIRNSILDTLEDL